LSDALTSGSAADSELRQPDLPQAGGARCRADERAKGGCENS